MIKKTRCSDSGYSFIELLVALALLGIVVTPFLNMFFIGLASINNARLQTTAINLCRSRLEQLRASGYDQVFDNYVNSHNEAHVEPDPEGYRGFQRETNVSLHLLPLGEPGHGPAELLLLEVTVTWLDRDQEHAETLSSYLSKR